MSRHIIFVLLSISYCVSGLNLNYLDPTKLQTLTSAESQQEAATKIINKYTYQVNVVVDPLIFNNKKDVFSIKTIKDKLQIRASSGVAALWGFNYYLKKYCKSQIAWQVNNINIPGTLPEVDEVVVANDRFRYFQNVCTASYSFVWWEVTRWFQHIEWMAFNGINIALGPVAQEAIWSRIYRRLGMTDDEISEHFTGPAFLSWLRMGNVHGWGGPLSSSWHESQKYIQDEVLNYMLKLGMIAVLPAFSGHVPKAFARLYPNTTLHSVGTWNKFQADYCCLLFVEPTEPLFEQLGTMFLQEMITGTPTNHIYSADPFNEITITPWSPQIVANTAISIFNSMRKVDDQAVWLIQNWMFVHDPAKWSQSSVKQFLTSVPNGRMLVLDLQSEQWPQYNLYKMYYGQPFIWCMLHNFGGTLGMFGNTKSINSEVYEARKRTNSTMIGVGLTPEGINQNYVVYDLMLENAWRKEPVDLNIWVEEYAERRYKCNLTGGAWRYLLKSVYSYDGLNSMRGKYVVTRRPSFNIKPWAWYSSNDLMKAWRHFIFDTDNCNSEGFFHDLVDLTRQALQYRAEQLYNVVVNERFGTTWAFNQSVTQFLDVMQDMEKILASNNDFTAQKWLSDSGSFGNNNNKRSLYEFNAKNQITLWGPNGEIADYACKQWAELFHYYYTPRWRAFLTAALDAKSRNEVFNEKSVQNMIRISIEARFVSTQIEALPSYDPKSIARELYLKWSNVPGLKDLPFNIIRPKNHKRTTLADVLQESDEDIENTVVMSPTTASFN